MAENKSTPEAPPRVKKPIVCTRCKGSGTWVSSRTGLRAKTACGKLADSSRKCPRCRGTKKSHVWISQAQADAEAKAKAASRSKAKSKVDMDARAAKKAIDQE